MGLRDENWSYRDAYKRRVPDGNEKLYINMLNRYKKMAISTFKWDSPESGLTDNLEKLLYDDYQAIIYDFPEYGLMCVKAMFSTYDIYGEPLTVTPIMPDKSEYKPISAEDCIIITDSQIYGSGRADDVAYWTDKYVDIQTTIDMQNINQRTPMLMLAGNQKDVEKLRSIVLDTMTGAKALVIEPNLKDMIVPLNFNAPFNVETLITIQKHYENKILESMGIDSMQAFGKKERLIVDEQESNDESLSAIIQDGLTARRKACKKAMELYGLDLRVDVFTPTRIVSDVDDGTGEYSETEVSEVENDN